MNLISYEESVKDLVKEIKQKRDGWRNLKNTYVNYSEYVSEQIDKSMSYTDYVGCFFLSTSEPVVCVIRNPTTSMCFYRLN